MVIKMISERIKKIASLVYPSKKIADVGCDHGYLIIECFEKYNILKAIAIDNKIMPLDSARNNINTYISSRKEDVRYSLSSGINDVDYDTDCIIVAGMGGALIKNIISDGFNINGKSHYEKMKFIFQPNRNVSELREYLNESSFLIDDEYVIYDDKKYYEIIVCHLSDSVKQLTCSEIEFGPINLVKKEDVFKEYYQNEVRKLQKVANKNTISINEKIERIKKICL